MLCFFCCLKVGIYHVEPLRTAEEIDEMKLMSH